MPILGTYNSVALTANVAVQITPPGTGSYLISFLNTAGGNLYISDAASVGANVTSFKLPANLYSPTVSGSSALWIASDTTGSVSAYCAAAR